MLSRREKRAVVHDPDCDTAVCAVETEMTVLARSLELLQRRAEPSPELDRAGYLLCRTLDQEGDATINALAELLRLDATTVTRQVNTLHASGFVARRTDPGDRRVSIITLTVDGRQAMDDLRRARRARTAELLDGFSARERTQLGALLGKLNTAIQARHLS